MPQTDANGATATPLGGPRASSGAARALPLPLALGALGLIGTAWGATVVAAKVAVSTGHHPLGLIFWQLVIVSAVLAPLALARRRAPRISPATLIFFAAVAAIGTLAPDAASYTAAARLPAGVLAIIVAAAPIASLLVASATGVERTSPGRIAGVGLGFAAILLILGPEAGLPDRSAWPFVLIALIAPVCYGVEGVVVAARTPARTDPVATLLGASLVGLVALAPLIATSPDLRVPFPGPFGPAEQAMLVGGLLHAACYTGYVWLVGVAGPVFASLVAYAVTLSGVFWGIVLLGESHSPWIWAALLAMVAGMTLVRPRR